MSVRTRLVLTMVAMGLLLLGPAIYGLQRLSALRDIALELQGEHATASLAVGRIRGALADLDLHERSYIASPDPAAREGVRGALTTVRNAAATLGGAGYGERMGELAEGTDSIAVAVSRIEQLIEGRRVNEATAAFGTLRRALGRQDSALASLALEIDRRSAGVAKTAREISTTAGWVVLMGVVFAVIFAVALGARTTRALTVPIHRLRKAMTRVAQGRFVAPERLPYQRQDELGDLSRSFRSMTEQLAELDRMRAEFMSVASHELRTPVHVISAYAQLIEHEMSADPSDDRAEMLRAMQVQVKSLAKMVNELLDLSRLEADAVTLDMAKVEVDQLLHAVRQTFDPLSRQQEIHLRIERDPSAPTTIVMHEDRIAQAVLGNLLSNAFKFTDAGGVVTLRVGGDTGSAWFEVSDTGRGVPPEDIPHVFEKYYQLTSRDRKMGAGLGLAVARAVTRAHGGDISVESEPGKGSTFRVTIPLVPIPSRAPDVEPASFQEYLISTVTGARRTPPTPVVSEGKRG